MRYIVLSPRSEQDVLWLMDEGDERFNSPDYQPVTRIVACGGKLARFVTGENGKRYWIFSDWSAKELG